MRAELLVRSTFCATQTAANVAGCVSGLQMLLVRSFILGYRAHPRPPEFFGSYKLTCCSVPSASTSLFAPSLQWQRSSASIIVCNKHRSCTSMHASLHHSSNSLHAATQQKACKTCLHRINSTVNYPIMPAIHGQKRREQLTCLALGGDDLDVSLADLRQQLDVAVREERYQVAARLRDAIQQKSVDVRLAVEDANQRFYNAFRSGNIKEMEAVWGDGEHVQVIHPGAECIAGREAVMASWRAILSGVRPRAFKIDVDDVRIWANDTAGYVTCVEIVDADDSQGRIVVTNVFEKQGQRWVMVLHHGGPAPIRRRSRSIGL